MTTEQGSTRPHNAQRQHPARGQARVVVVGGGMTGLCAAALLSKLGHAVTLLEAHPHYLGGHARTLAFQGAKFCAGPQFVWNFVGGKHATGSSVMRFLSIEHEVPFQIFDAACQERLFLGDRPPLDVPRGMPAFRAALAERYPEQQAALACFFDKLSLLFQGAAVLHDERAYVDGKARMMWEILRSERLAWSDKFQIARLAEATLAELFDQCDLAPEIRRLLYSHGGIFAENADSISVGVYAAATGYCHQGMAFPRKGFESLVEALASTIRRHGGSVHMGKRVNGLKIEDGKVTAAVCSDGSVFACDVLISNLSPRMTCALIDGCDTTQYAYQPSNSLVGCFMVLDDYPRLSELKRRNYWWQAFPEPVDYEKPDATQKPTMMFVGSESANGVRYEGLASQPDTLTVFVPGSFDQAKDAFDRGPDFYTTYKEKIGAAILSAVQAHLFSDLAPSLRAMLILTPWDLYQELGAEAGNVYGRRLDVRNMLRKVKGLPSVSNLRIACATVGNPGIETAFQTAVAVVEELTGERI